MNMAKQLYQLQEVDFEIEAAQQEWRRLQSRLGERQALIAAQARLTSEKRRLDELKRQQNSAEWEIDDLMNRISEAEKQLYSGRIKNPKELTNLQHEVEILKSKRDQLENKALEIMDQVEHAGADAVALNSEFNKLEAEWHRQQKQILGEIETLKNRLSGLEEKRRMCSGAIDPPAIALYDKLRKQKGQAVAKVEQGICWGCRISLSFSELQQARSGNLVQCSSCGRILFLP
jgi:hypothetical protein